MEGEIKMKPVRIAKDLLREGVSFSQPFTVSELPHKAKLDQNEAPFDLPDHIKSQLTEKLTEYQWNRYPQPSTYLKAKESFAKTIGFKPENIVLTMGGDQLIQAAYLIAGGHNRNALIFEPTYPMFFHAAKFNQTNVTRIELSADELPTKRHINESEHNIVFLVSPNNPTGAAPGDEVVEAALSMNSLVFLDEAYVDYAKKSMAHLVNDYPNLFIARSTSKSCLAGIRLGYGIGHPDIINAMETILTAPYHLSYLQLTIAKHFDIIKPHLNDLADVIIAERERVSKRFKDMGVSFIPSQCNFILFKVADAPAIFLRLSESGVRVRSLHSIPGLSEYVRVTIGKREENDIFLEKLGELI